MMIAGVCGAVGSELLRLVRVAGWDAVGLYHRQPDRAEALRREWGEARNTVTMLACDLTDGGQVGEMLKQLPEGYCPDVLVHLAAPLLDVQPLHRIDWDEYQRQMDGILKSAVLLTQPLLRRMIRGGGGWVIAALSAVVLGTPPRGFAAYTAAKYALQGYMKCLAAEYADRGIVAACVSPGPMNTGMLRNLPELLKDQIKGAGPDDRWIEPAAVARVIFHLAAEEGPEVNGSNVAVTTETTP